MAPVWGQGLDELVKDRATRVDNLQQKSKHNPLKEGKRVGRGSQGLSLAKQVGVSAQGEINPHNVVVATFDSGKDQGHQMLAVKKPTSPEKVKDIEDQRMVNNCLGDARSNPVPSVVAYGNTRQGDGKSRGGRGL